MSKPEDLKFPFMKRLAWSLLLPALVVGFAFSILSTHFIAPSLISLLENHMRAELKLATGMAMRICEERFNDLLELRLEKDPEMIATARRESVNEIKSISKKLHGVHMLIIEDNRTLLGSSLDAPPGELPLPLSKKAPDNIIDQSIGGEPAKMYYQYFPLWKWHIVSFTYDQAFLAPILLVIRMLYVGTFSIMTVLVLTVFLVFRWRVKKPLNQIIMATRALAQGEFKTLEVTRQDEIAQVALAFNSMLGSLQQELLERQKAEEALRESEKLFRSLVENIALGITLISPDYRIKLTNAAQGKIFRKPPSEFIGKECFREFEKRPAVCAHCPGTIAMATGQTAAVETEGKRDDGSLIAARLHAFPSFGPDGEITGFIEVVEDISNRKLAEEELRDTRERLELALQGADMGSWDWNVQTGAVIYNKRWAEMLGYSLEEMESHFRSWEKLVHPDDLPGFLGVLNAHLESKTAFYETEHRLRHKSGEWLWVLDKGKVIERDAQGKPIRACGTQLDITGRKQAEAEQLRFSKLESLGILAGGIAHDFNNILTAIIGNISLAMLDIQKKEYLRERLNEAEKACHQAQNLSRQLLTFSKGGAPIKKVVSMRELAAETASFACRGSLVHCQTSLPDDLWAVEADPGQISQVLHNLVINAIQAMPGGGMVRIRGENLVMEAGNELGIDAGRYVKISIQDEGIGISADHLSKIFDPYFTTKQTGSGLGLATAYSIIQNHRGHISVESKLEKGSTFHVYLPASDQKVTQQLQENQELIAGKGKILIMDDEPIIREVLGKMLLTMGYEVESAGDGAQALALYTQAQDTGDPFVTVILDLTVPGGMGGKEAMERLLKIDPQVKAIVSSGYSDDPVMAGFLSYGFIDVIAKPYRISELDKVLKNILTGCNLDP
jgi:PAS domain S-box-containing protein